MIALSRATYDETIARLREQADADMAAYSQYKGHFDGPAWRLARIARRVETKMGLAFEEGDIVLATRSALNWSGPVAYSFRNRCDTACFGALDWIIIEEVV